MERARWLVAVVAALALAVAAAACGESAPARPDDPVLALGQDIYDRSCASCHGRAGGGGGVGPKLSGVVAANLTFEEHVRVITEGKGSGMPGWEGRLTPEEIEAVARYEREVL